jgi:hypothetical protein
MKLIKILSLLLLISIPGFSQQQTSAVKENLYFIKGAIGTSWIIMPKVFLLNPIDTNNVQILPATNSFTGYVGFQTVIPLGDHWLFTPEINLNYISGEIRVDHVNGNRSSQKLQTYARLELPINFGVKSSDNFWVTFGPVLFFTLADNKGFDAAVHDLEDPNRPIKLNSDNPVGLRFRLATYIVVAKGMYIDIKFDSDLKRDFYYENDVYNMKMSLQSITVGFGYRINRKGL